MINVSISPAKLQLQLKPGSTYVQSYIVKNIGDQKIILNSSVESWIPQGINGNVTYLNSKPNLNISLSNSDLTLGQPFSLNPNQSQQLVLKIKVPENSDQGDHYFITLFIGRSLYFTLFANQETSAYDKGNSSQIIRLGSHLLISVSNTEEPKTELTVSNFKINNPFIDCFFFPLKFSGEITNQTNYFTQINKTITISKNNNIVKQFTIFPDNVLAHHSRAIRCQSDDNPIECQFDKPLWPGFYQAKIDNQTLSFIVFPYTLTLGIILIATLFWIRSRRV